VRLTFERENFLPSEVDAIWLAMMPLEEAAAKERQGTRTDLTCGKVSHMSVSDSEGKQRARDKVGAFAGLSGRTVEKITTVCEAGSQTPAASYTGNFGSRQDGRFALRHTQGSVVGSRRRADRTKVKGAAWRG
jgi:hypothetical protein